MTGTRYLLSFLQTCFNTVEIYVNGFSTSLPEEVQYEAIRRMNGFENAKMFRPGYAIEYDYFPPTQLRHSPGNKTYRQSFFCRSNKWNNRL